MKILILSANVGGGHMASAKAIKEYADKQDNIAVHVLDGIEISGHYLNKLVISSYKFMVQKAPYLFKFIYKISDKKTCFGKFVFYFFYKKSKHLLPIIEKEKPDIIISTHPFPMEMTAALKRHKLIDIPLINVMTDYVPHQTWIDDEVDEYIVATKEMIPKMNTMGAKIDRINPYGIPVKPQFNQKYDKNKLKDELNIVINKPVLLVMAGSFGIKSVLEIYNDILSIDKYFQIILITGNNEKLYNKLQYEIDDIKKTGKDVKNTKLIMFTNEIYKYMNVSDILITKPGGLTISEALASDLPMVLFKPIPGQEDGNQNFLIKNNMALKIDKNNTKKVLEYLLNDKNRIQNLKKYCHEFDKSKSCEFIIDKAKLYMER